MKPCKRCSKPFEPEPLPHLGTLSQCCPDCQVRNLYDMLDLPTPPDMLDRHTVHPTLTAEEYWRKMGTKIELA